MSVNKYIDDKGGVDFSTIEPTCLDWVRDILIELWLKHSEGNCYGLVYYRLSLKNLWESL